jgi:hypothetical protein
LAIPIDALKRTHTSLYTEKHPVIIETENFRFGMVLQSLMEMGCESAGLECFDFDGVPEALSASMLVRMNHCRWQCIRVRGTNNPDSDHVAVRVGGRGRFGSHDQTAVQQ